MTASILIHAQPTCEEGGAASIESSMRPHCLNTDACAAKSKATHCRRCWGLKLNSMGRSSENETYRRDRAAESLGTRSAKRWSDPEYRERIRQLARERGTLQTPEAIARRDDPEVIRRRSAAANMAATKVIAASWAAPTSNFTTCCGPRISRPPNACG
jgi:hypothetical protein